MMFFWKQNEHQARNAQYHKKVKDSDGPSTPHGNGSPAPNTSGQRTINSQPSHVNINDHTIHSRSAAIPATDETPLSSTSIRDSKSRLPPDSSTRTPLEKQGTRKAATAHSRSSSSTGPQVSAGTSTQVRHTIVEAAPTGRLRNKLSRSCLVTLPESPAPAKDIACSSDDDVRPKTDPSKLVLKYRKMTDKPQLEGDGSGVVTSPSSGHRSDTPSTPDLPSMEELQELFMSSKPKETSLDGQGKQDHKDAMGDEALEEDQIKEVAVDDRPAPAVRPTRGDETPCDDGADQIINSNKVSLDAKGNKQDGALHHDPGDRSPNDHHSSAFEQHESFDFLRRSSRAKRPLVKASDPTKGDYEMFFNVKAPWDDDQEVVIDEVASTEPSPKRRRESEKKKQPPQPLISNSSLRSSKTSKARKKKFSLTKAPKKVRDETQTTDATDVPMSDSVIIHADKNSSACGAPLSSSLTPDNPRTGPKSEEAVDKTLVEPKRRVNVSFVIVQRRNALTVKQSWPEGKLRGKSVEFLFDAVSKMCKRTNIEQIHCTLFTSMTVYIEILRRGDNEGFLRMERNFTKEISKAINTNGNDGKEIEICIEPLGPEETTAENRAEVADIEVGDW